VLDIEWQTVFLWRLAERHSISIRLLQSMPANGLFANFLAALRKPLRRKNNEKASVNHRPCHRNGHFRCVRKQTRNPKQTSGYAGSGLEP
jgi:hypothetical protein